MCFWILGASAAPKVLSKRDLTEYKEVFAAHQRGHFKTARTHQKKISNHLLQGYILLDRYFSKKYATTQKEISDWLSRYSDLPVAVDMYALGKQKKLENLKRPKGLFGMNTQACASPTRQEPIDLIRNPSFSYLDGEEHDWAIDKMHEIAKLIKQGKNAEARETMEDKKVQHLFSREDLDKIKIALAFGYVLSNDNEKGLELAKASLHWTSKAIPLAYWVAGLASWRLDDLKSAAGYFSKLADDDSAPVPLRTRAAFWAARAYLATGKYVKVISYLVIATHSPRNFYGMLALRALGGDLNYIWETPVLPQDDLQASFSHPALERFYALRELGKKEWASQELSKLYLESDEETKSILMLISAKNGFDDVLQSLTGTLHGEEARYPMPNWCPQGGWQLDQALVYAFVRQESCFNHRAESYVGALGLMQLMPDTAKELAGTLQCRYSKHALKDPAYNLRLGQAYLMQLMELPQVQNNLIFLAVAYNAGPGNLNKWRRKTNNEEDPLLFLESLPSKETRSFVERILANYWVYRNLMAQPLTTLDEVVRGEWPIYVPKN